MMVAGHLTPSVNLLAAQLVAHAQLVPSATNPRKKFDEAKLRELAESMKPPVGILEPLVVRRISVERAKALGLNPPDQFFEIIAGERRWRAAAIARLTEIPVVVRDVDDEHVLRLQLIENTNREDVHPLDEAEAIERLLKLNRAETPKTIATAIGMSERYVQNRLHYLRLVPDVKEAFRKEEIAAGHVDLLMRLPAEDQRRAFKEGTYADEFDYDDEAQKQTKHKRLASVRELGHWIKHHVQLRVEPKSPEMELFPELAAEVSAAAVDNAPKLLELTDDWSPQKGPNAPLSRSAWQLVKKGEKCAYQVRGVMVLGDRRGAIRTVCVGVGQCETHWKHTIEKAAAKGERATPQKKTAEQEKWERQAAERKARAEQWVKVRPAAVKAARDAAAKLKPGPVAFELLADTLREALFLTKIPKRPTLGDLLVAVIDHTAEDDAAVFETSIAKPLGINLKRLFADAARVGAALKAESSLAGAKIVKKLNAELRAKKAKKPARESLSKTASPGTRKALAPRKRKAGKKR